MRSGKKPTRAERKLLARWSLDPANWLVCKRGPEKTVVRHRHTEAVKEIPEGYAGRNH